MSRRYDNYLEVVHNVGLVSQMERAGRSKEEIIIELVNQREIWLDKIRALELIAPKKYRAGENVYVSHCPNELIPETVVGSSPEDYVKRLERCEMDEIDSWTERG